MCDLISDIAHLTGWDPDTIANLPFHHALYYQIKAHSLRTSPDGTPHFRAWAF